MATRLGASAVGVRCGDSDGFTGAQSQLAGRALAGGGARGFGGAGLGHASGGEAEAVFELVLIFGGGRAKAGGRWTVYLFGFLLASRFVVLFVGRPAGIEASESARYVRS